MAGVQEIRDIILESINVAPARDRYKVFIIDEVHMLSTSSFNALLKTVEEPPPNVVFVMATTELHKVPDTITSRSQEFIFRTIPQIQIFITEPPVRKFTPTWTVTLIFSSRA